MPGLDVNTNPLVTSTKPYPSSVATLASRVQAQGLTEVAQALMLLQKHAEDNSRALRQSPPTVNHIIATDQNGNMAAQIGELPTKDGRILYGLQGVTLYVGDVLGDGDPSDAPVYADSNGVHVGKSGWMDVLDPFGVEAAWIGAQFDAIAVTGAINNGSGLIRLTVPGHTLSTGDTPRVLNVGGVPNATGQRVITVVDASHIDLQNSVFAGTYTSGGTVDRILHVTGAANNGSGAIRLTLTAHGYQTGDRVTVASVGGVPNATGQWPVTVIDANHIDLKGSTWAGAYTSGGIALRYFAGGLFQNIAIGQSFANYSLRGFPDGTLKINNALITLTGTGAGSAVITLDPTLGEIEVVANSPGTIETLINAGGIDLYVPAGSQPGLLMTNSNLELYNSVTASGNPPVFAVSGQAVLMIPGNVSILDNSGNPAIVNDYSSGVHVYSGGSDLADLSTVDGSVNGALYKLAGGTIIDTHQNMTLGGWANVSGGYRVGAAQGVNTGEFFVQTLNLTTASFITSVTGSGISTTAATAVTNVTTNTKTNTITGGIITAVF